MPAGGWQRYTHAEPVWGSVITFDVRGDDLDPALVAEAFRVGAAELHRIDEWCSTFRPGSPVSLIRAGKLMPGEAPQAVREVYSLCLQAKDLSGGYFDPWAVPGGWDPSGLVKGWGADRVSDIFVAFGLVNNSVNAAGDVTCRGGDAPDASGWSIGIADPRKPSQVIETVTVIDGHIATSGRYEQGEHIATPKDLQRDVDALSATVIGGSGALSDALATGLLLAGPSGLSAIGTKTGNSAFLVTQSTVWTVGPMFTG